MIFNRRRFLGDGTQLVAALATGPFLSALFGCSRRDDSGSGRVATVQARPAPSYRPADVCGGASRRPRANAVPEPARVPLHPDKLARFVDPLPIPPVLVAEGTRPDPHDEKSLIPYHRIAMRETPIAIHRDVPPTMFWTYGGVFPGPTLEARSGKPILVEWVNELPTKHCLSIDHTLCGASADRPDVRAIVHLHGGRVPPDSDGYPENWYPPGKSLTSYYPNRQDATTLWYHDHAMGIERLNQYAGLFGAYVIRDDVEDALDLPRGEHEVPLMLCDRSFNADGALHYPTSGDPDAPWIPEFFGDALLVNGKLFPFLEVEPRKYRFRVVNASNSRFFYLSLSNDRGFHQIGTDQGLLPAPVPMKSVTVSPGERVDLVVDFSAARNTKLVLKSQAFELMQFRVKDVDKVHEKPLPGALRKMPPLAVASAVKTRRLALREYEGAGHRMLMLLDGKRFAEPVSEKPVLDSVEIWELVNTTEDTHPIHLHLVRFRIIERQRFDDDAFLTTGKVTLLPGLVPPDPGEAGWKDTVRADPGLVTRILVRFEGYTGRYLWHCHLLEHAASEMMRPFEVVPA
ncbi:MAG TPA: multicopper oxidase domain-containing protein [Polyangiaceae bacterium]|jgi:spore coat protein A|nr:multicopper oxidase domain-containing protein [Polyangiaceae bacterium]